MTAQPFIHGRAGEAVNSPSLGAGDDYPFKADVLVACPYCDDGPCDRCDGTGVILADEVLTELDLHRLDCAVDALRGADLSAHRETLSRIASNLNDLMENPHGHAH